MQTRSTVETENGSPPGLLLGSTESVVRSAAAVSTEGRELTKTAMAHDPAGLQRPMSTIAYGSTGSEAHFGLVIVEPKVQAGKAAAVSYGYEMPETKIGLAL